MKTETLKSETTNFQPILLYIDEREINKEIKRIEKGASLLNEFLGIVDSELYHHGWEITLEIKDLIRLGGMTYLNNRLKEKYPFKNSTREFNLEALGLTSSFRRIEAFYNKNSPYWNRCAYQLNKSGDFEPFEPKKYDDVKRHYHYTKNQKQNDALKLAKELEAIFIKTEEQKYLLPYNREQINNVTPLLDYHFDEEKNLRIHPDYVYIERIK